jgi:L-threonylcarbamoyladenylate synthase
MITRLTRSPRIAAQFIRRGEVVAFPTETVYGLGADVFNEAAIERIFNAKGRPTDNPLIAHIAAVEQIELLARDIPPAAIKLIEAFFPGPLTIVLPKRDRVPLIATAGLETIGIRLPRHPLAHEFILACNTPLVAPSANLSGRPSPTTWQAVKSDLDGRISCILQGAQTEVGLESTVIDGTGPHPVLLRAGAVTLEQLRAVIPETRLASAGDKSAPRSPGLKYRHYAPRAEVYLITRPSQIARPEEAGYIGLDEPGQGFRLVRRCRDLTEYARELFQFFRECDAVGVRDIYCQEVDEEGLGLALMDRLHRAAHR